jgi:hypothetical protein
VLNKMFEDLCHHEISPMSRGSMVTREAARMMACVGSWKNLVVQRKMWKLILNRLYGWNDAGF